MPRSGFAPRPHLRNSSNWKICPPHISTLYALATIDKRVGPGPLAKRMTRVVHDEMSVADVDALVAELALTPKLSPAEGRACHDDGRGMRHPCHLRERLSASV
jgi:hypothetical protein